MAINSFDDPISDKDGDELDITPTGEAETLTKSDLQSDYYPSDSFTGTGLNQTTRVDSDGSLMTRGPIFSDEGSFRFYYTTDLDISLTGTVSFTNASDIITGSGTLFTTELKRYDYIKLSTDATQYYAQITEIISDTELILTDTYGGSTSSGTGTKSNYNREVSGTGADISITSEILELTSGTANAGYAVLWRSVDYMPMSMVLNMSLSQAIADQTITVGLQADIGNTGSYVQLIFSGAFTNQFTFRSGNSATAYEDTTVTIQFGGTIFDSHDYEINILPTKIILLIDKKIYATHYRHIPLPYEVLGFFAKMLNSAAVTETVLSIETHYVSNINTVSISNPLEGETVKVEIVENNENSQRTFGLSDGFVTTSATSKTAIRKTTYTEQTTNSQMSIASSSANDTSAGTGARSVKVVYYDQYGLGPYEVTANLSGTTGVNLNTGMCFIEYIEVVSVGSGATNAGTITLYSAINKGGSTVGTISTGDGKTFWAHHYIPDGSTCYITSFQCNTTGSVLGNGGTFVIQQHDVVTPNRIDIEVSDRIFIPGAANPFARNWDSPIKIVGPKRLTAYITPASGATYNNYAAFSFYEE